MWNLRTPSSARGSYEKARTSDEESDEQTLADDSDLAQASGRDEAKHPSTDNTYDELPLADPRYENNAHMTRKDSAHRLNRWRLRPNVPAPLDLRQETDGTAGLMNDETNAALVSAAAISPRWAQAGQQTVSWLVWPLPSWTHHFFGVRYPEEPRRATDYLDGLRGVASLFVFFDHYLVRVHNRIVHEGFGNEDHWNILQLPFVRTVYSGPAMVAIFFVISGYVLSQRCLVAIRNRQQEKLHNALTSMTFRRAIRLFLPSVVISLIALSFVLVGILGPEWPEDWTWGEEFENFQYRILYDLFKLWDWGITYDHWYAPQLWTIPVEYRCSMILFMFILMVARTTAFARYTIEIGTLFYLFYIERWDVGLFLAGMAIAELNLIFEDRHKRQAGPTLTSPEKTVATPRWRTRWFTVKKSHIPLWVMLIAGFYLTSYPDTDAEYTPGFDFIANSVGDEWDFKFRFWLSMAAILVVLPISFLPKAQALFTTPIARYLGKISYALYLVHELMNVTLRVALWNMFWSVLKLKKEDGEEGLKFEGGWIIGSFVYIPLVLWAADVFWRAVDIPTVKFAKWFEGKCFEQS